MRTTLNIDDTLFLRLKQRAQERGVTLTREIEDALTRAMLEPAAAPARRPYRVPVVRGRGAYPVDVADRDALETWLERHDHGGEGTPG